MASSLSFGRVACVAFAVAALVACSSSSDGGASSSSSSSSSSSGSTGGHEVKVSNFKFDPANLTIKAGETVTWTWQNGTHSVVEGSSCTKKAGGFDSGQKTGSGTFQQTFPTAGTYPYFCDYMDHCSQYQQVGTITVQ